MAGQYDSSSMGRMRAAREAIGTIEVRSELETGE